VSTIIRRFSKPRSVDLFDNIRDSSRTVAMASLTFLHGSGWMSKQLAQSLPAEPIEIVDDWRDTWEDRIWEWDL
jgi:hypothetical protein